MGGRISRIPGKEIVEDAAKSAKPHIPYTKPAIAIGGTAAAALAISAGVQTVTRSEQERLDKVYNQSVPMGYARRIQTFAAIGMLLSVPFVMNGYSVTGLSMAIIYLSVEPFLTKVF